MSLTLLSSSSLRVRGCPAKYYPNLHCARVQAFFLGVLDPAGASRECPILSRPAQGRSDVSGGGQKQLSDAARGSVPRLNSVKRRRIPLPSRQRYHLHKEWGKCAYTIYYDDASILSRRFALFLNREQMKALANPFDDYLSSGHEKIVLVGRVTMQ